MVNLFRSKKSFTMIELMMIIIILAVLIAAAVARIINIKEDAKTSVEQQTVRVVRNGIQTYYYESIINERMPLYPAELDTAAVGTTASSSNPFFSKVVESPGVTYGAWKKVAVNQYQGPTGTVYTYNNTTGIFTD